MKLEELVNQNYHHLNENDLYIWNYIINHRELCEHLSIDDLAMRCNVSRSTILRFSKRLGLKGYAEFKVLLRMDNQRDDSGTVVENIYNQFVEVIEQFREYRYFEIAKKIYDAKNLFVHGTGTLQESVARYMKRTFSLTNKLFLDIDSLAEFDVYLDMFKPHDVFVAISFGGENKRLLENVYRLKAKGVIVIAIVASNDCTLSHVADYNLYVRVLPYMSNLGRRETLVSNYYVLIDFMLINYIEYANSRGKNNDIR